KKREVTHRHTKYAGQHISIRHCASGNPNQRPEMERRDLAELLHAPGYKQVTGRTAKHDQSYHQRGDHSRTPAVCNSSPGDSPVRSPERETNKTPSVIIRAPAHLLFET